MSAVNNWQTLYLLWNYIFFFSLRIVPLKLSHLVFKVAFLKQEQRKQRFRSLFILIVPRGTKKRQNDNKYRFI